MEFVFKGQTNNDLFIKPRKDGSIEITIQAKNLTGRSSFVLSSEEFELLCVIREKSINLKTE